MVIVSGRAGDGRALVFMVERGVIDSSLIAVGDDRDANSDLDSNLWLDVYLSSPLTLLSCPRLSYKECPQKDFNLFPRQHGVSRPE